MLCSNKENCIFIDNHKEERDRCCCRCRCCSCCRCCRCCKGEQGERGEQGPMGPQGEKGEQGERGEQGPEGPRGNQGPMGLQGEKGEQGERGEQGPAGPQGPSGGQGSMGLNGEKGEQGEQGPEGPQGPRGEQGPVGPKGEKGEQGERGEQGPEGECYCRCVSSGELLVNGGMEYFDGDIPTGWNYESTSISSLTKNSTATAPGRVHTGASSISLRGSIYQTVPNIQEGCFYELSFFCRENFIDVRLYFSVYVIFETEEGSVLGAEIYFDRGSMPDIDRNFGYYRILTTAAPVGVKSARIRLGASYAQNTKSTIDIDDISFSIQ